MLIQFHLQGIKRLTRLIFMRAQPKRVGNKIITGSLLAALASEYVEAINQGAVPTIATAWQVRLRNLSIITYALCSKDWPMYEHV